MWHLLLFGILVGCGRSKPAQERAEPTPEAETGPVMVQSQGLEADLAATTAFFANRPHYEQPWATGLEQVPGLPDLSARTCGSCHTEIHSEWQTSVHAQAWTDPQYQAEIGKSGNRWLCLNCHTPLLTQQDLWPRDLVDGDVERPVLSPNPVFDAALRDEGITCATCHVREGAIAGPGLGGEAPHPVVVDPDLRSGAMCRKCHDVQVTYPQKSFACTFETGLEFDAGPWAAEGATCTSCHMPEIERPVAIGGEPKRVGRHWWRGSGIPKSVDGPYPPTEANPFGLEVDARRDGDDLVVKMTNAHAGHMLPSGDPERWVQVDIDFLDESGGSLAAQSIRFAQTWEWSVPPRKLSDNRLAPRETRVHRFSAPAGATVARIQASNHRISKENAEYHHLGDYPRSVVVHESEVDLTGPAPPVIQEQP